MNKEIALVYMVAGMSSRFGGKIKQFAKVGPNNSTLIEYSLQQALPAGFSKIIFIVGKMTSSPFKETFGDNYQSIPVEYATQTFDETTRDRPRGTVDALCSAKDLITGPCVVCNGDDIYGTNSFKILFDHLQNSDESVSIGYILENVVPDKGSVNRGIFQIDGENYVQDIKEMIGIEKQKLSEIGLNNKDLCSMNIFGLSKSALEALNNRSSYFKIEHNGDRKIECYLPVEISNIVKEEGFKMKLYSTPDTRFGVTNPEDEELVKKQIEEYENN
ncbi:MAG: sugar phosphate nucleotidyltransferase [Candidatus Absconditicoccaceae bacterium]